MIRAFLLAAVLVGCGSTTAEVQRAIRTGAEFAETVEPILVMAYRFELENCLTLDEADACVDKVQKRWDPIINKYDAARSAWCAVDATIGQGKCK